MSGSPQDFFTSKRVRPIFAVANEIMKRLVLLGMLVLAGCVKNVPALVPPDRVESFCDEKEPRGTAIASVLSSVGDRIEPTEYPGDKVLHTDVKTNGGVIGHWKTQPLYMPKTARALNIDGDYIDVTDIFIDNQLAGAESRLIYVTVKTPNGPKKSCAARVRHPKRLRRGHPAELIWPGGRHEDVLRPPWTKKPTRRPVRAVQVSRIAKAWMPIAKRSSNSRPTARKTAPPINAARPRAAVET